MADQSTKIGKQTAGLLLTSANSSRRQQAVRELTLGEVTFGRRCDQSDFFRVAFLCHFFQGENGFPFGSDGRVFGGPRQLLSFRRAEQAPGCAGDAE